MCLNTYCLQAQKIFAQADALVEEVDQKVDCRQLYIFLLSALKTLFFCCELLSVTLSCSQFSEASLRSRANGRIVRTPRGAVRGGRVSRRATGTTRARRPARGQPFNRSVDRRPKRLRISALDKDEKQTLTNQVEVCAFAKMFCC